MPIPPAQAVRKLVLLVFTAALLSFILALFDYETLAGLVFWRIGIASMLIAIFLLLLFPDASFRETGLREVAKHNPEQATDSAETDS